MASPQKENGYTPIANEILEALARQPLNGTQWRILMVIFRYTYGFSRKGHELSEGFISKATGIHPKQIGRELSCLIRNGLICIKKNATFTEPRILMFNKDYGKWNKVSTISLTGNKEAPPNEKVELTGSELVDRTGSELVDQEKKYIKKTLKKDICPYSQIQELFNKNCTSLPKVNKLTESRKKKLSSRWKEMPDLQQWVSLFKMVEKTPFLTGQNNRGWRASFDWLIENDTNIVKVLEGKYSGMLNETGNMQSKYRDMTNYDPGRPFTDVTE